MAAGPGAHIPLTEGAFTKTTKWLGASTEQLGSAVTNMPKEAKVVVVWCSLRFPAQGELALIFKLAFGRYQPEDIRIEGSIERFGTVVGRPRAHRWSFLLIRARSRLSLWLPGSAE